MKPWWEKFPGRLEYELEELKSAGFSYELDEEAFAGGTGAIHLHKILEDGREVELTVRFPYFYPYFRFDVTGDNLELKHHQHPFGNNLCLIGRDPEKWHTSDTVAKQLEEMLPDVIKAGESEDEALVSHLEEDQAEPYSDNYSYPLDFTILYDSDWRLDPNARSGFLDIGLHPSQTGNGLNAAVLSVLDGKKQVLAQADESLCHLYAKKLSGRWIRVDEPIQEDHPEKFLEVLYRINPRLKNRNWKTVAKNTCDILGVVFPEETERRQHSDGWVFLLFTRQGSGKKTKFRAHFIQPDRAGRSDMVARVPTFSILSGKRVAVLGLGCLGAPSVLEFARCGVGELRILDFDHVEAGTTVRWPFGLTAAARSKALVLNEFVGLNYPYTKVVPFPLRLGAIQYERPEIPEPEIVKNFLEGIDLIYDATTDLNVQHLFSDLARDSGIPYIAISTTLGTWGGQIIRGSRPVKWCKKPPGSFSGLTLCG